MTVAALALALAGCSLGRPAQDATGEEIYTQLCARCHAPDLSGGLGPPLGPGSQAAFEGEEFIEFSIRNGRGRMPSFSSTLSDAQIDRLVQYILEEQDGG